MDLQSLLAPVAGVFDIDQALEAWRWLVPQQVCALVVTAAGDLFVTNFHGEVLYLDTINGTCQTAAESVAAWERMLMDPKVIDRWFMPAFVEKLREAAPLSQGECYSPIHPPIMNGTYAVANWPPTDWRVHFWQMGTMHHAIKDLPDGTQITNWNYTKL
jgi:hypothetical protein